MTVKESVFLYSFAQYTYFRLWCSLNDCNLFTFMSLASILNTLYICSTNFFKYFFACLFTLLAYCPCKLCYVSFCNVLKASSHYCSYFARALNLILNHFLIAFKGFKFVLLFNNFTKSFSFQVISF